MAVALATLLMYRHDGVLIEWLTWQGTARDQLTEPTYLGDESCVKGALAPSAIKESAIDLALVIVAAIALRLAIPEAATWRLAGAAFLLVWVMRLADSRGR